MSNTIPDPPVITQVGLLQVAIELVQQASDAGIAVSSVDTYLGSGRYPTIGIFAEDDAQAPALALLLGLDSYRLGGVEQDIDVWTGTVGVIEVKTQRPVVVEAVSR